MFKATNSISLIGCLLILAMIATATAPVGAQDLFKQFKPDGQQDFGGEPLSVGSWFKVKEGTRSGNIYVQATMGSGYHTYSQNHPGPEVKTSIKVPVSDSFKVTGNFQPDPAPHVYERDGEQAEEFEKEVTWSAPFELADGVDPETLVIAINYEGQVCDSNSCQAPKTFELKTAFDSYDADLAIADSQAGFTQDHSDEDETNHTAPRKTDSPEALEAMAQLYDPSQKIDYVKLDGSTGTGTFWAAIFGAFFGGMLLNLMPCVFPVLGIKVMGFVEQAGSDPRKIRMHGIAFALGLLVSMWVLAGIILAIKAATGEAVNWGQQMGNPYFVGAIVILLFVLGLNMAGVFEMGLFMSKAAGAEKQGGYFGSFFSGIITTLVATPCSGPFLGAAMGYTLNQTAPIAMLLFTIFGLGIAVPYLLLSFIPKLMDFLPRPGAWMETFKKLMAFTLFAAAAFFVKSFGNQTGVDGLSWFLMALCVIALGTFFYGKWSPPYVKTKQRVIWGWVAPLLVVGVGGWMYIQAAQIKAPEIVSDSHGWESWVPGRVEQALADNQPVWVDYTADW